MLDAPVYNNEKCQTKSPFCACPENTFLARNYHILSFSFPASVPPPPQAPAQPPPPPSPSKAPPQKTSTRPKTAERGALLSSICDFKKGGLKKTETNDKSKPRIWDAD